MAGTIRIDTDEVLLYAIAVLLYLIYAKVSGVSGDVREIRQEVAPREWELDLQEDEDVDEEAA